jgi:alkylated DNA nucleotide flippase Atl1
MRASEVELLKPLLIWLHEPALQIPLDAINSVISAAESWVVRRQLLRLPGSDLGRIVADLIKSHRGAPSSELPSRVIAHLVDLNVSSTYWPGDEEIRASLRTELAYRRFRRGRLRMLLEAVENHHRSGTNQPQVPRRGYPIEHILPQSWSGHWPVEGPEAEQDRAAHVHRLGNLTLLTKSLNSKVSNGPWDAKRAALQQHDTLLINSRLITSTAGAPWDEAGIDERTRRHTDILLQVWPVPVGHEGAVVDPQVRGQEGVEIRHLVTAGLLSPGTMLTPRPGAWASFEALVRADGLLEVNGQTFETPSGAGKFVKGAVTNGWHFWRLPDGRKLLELRSALTGAQPAKAESSFDWSTLHAILEAIPTGYWATYGSLADAVGTAPQPLGNHMVGCGQCANPHRVLKTGGYISPNFAWRDPNDQRAPLEMLLAEGLAFSDGKADPERELAADELVALTVQ